MLIMIGSFYTYQTRKQKMKFKNIIKNIDFKKEFTPLNMIFCGVLCFDLALKEYQEAGFIAVLYMISILLLKKGETIEQ